ncbi:MAG TPA: polysaccharide biosynthesis/export family protein [Prosthecobacter sp.]|nr:polysaccharide biosynthesis/export family protein [Prosthecobacter sp.]
MSSVKIALACLALGSATAFAQDPGFRQSDDRRPPAPAAAAAAAPGEIARSAAYINSMDVLDDTQPIAPGDILSIRIVEDRREPLQLRVSATGEINAPHINLIRAAGRTCRELAFAVKRELEKSYYNSATVIISIDQMRERIDRVDLSFFTIYGQVLRQGKYELPTDEDVTISQAILRAGGFAQFAHPQKVKLVRKTPQGNKTVMVDLDQIMSRGNLEYDIYLRNNDVIIVPEKKVNF